MSDTENNNFPTGKPHISFSEIKQWKECPFRHKLTYIDKLDVFEPSPYLNFGTAVHAGCESLLETKKVDKHKLLKEMKIAWDQNDFENPEWYSKMPGWYKHEPVDTWCQWAENMWDEVIPFLDSEFPGWELHEAEEKLYEPILDKDLSFKGFIDAVIKVPKTRGSGYTYWIIDWKTSKKIETSSYAQKMGTHSSTRHVMDCNFYHYSLQLSLYRYILEEFYGLKIRNQLIAHLKDDTVNAIITPYMRDEIVEMLKYREELQ